MKVVRGDKGNLKFRLDSLRRRLVQESYRRKDKFFRFEV